MIFITGIKCNNEKIKYYQYRNSYYNRKCICFQTTEECPYIATDEFPLELCKAIPIIFEGVKEGLNLTEIQSHVCSVSNTMAWNLSVLYETAMITLSEAIFHLKGVKNRPDEQYIIDSQYSTTSQGLYALVKAIEKTSIECEEVFAIIKSRALSMPEEELPDIDWITGDQTTIPETFHACQVGDVEMYSDIESLNSPKDDRRFEHISPATEISVMNEMQVINLNYFRPI